MQKFPFGYSIHPGEILKTEFMEPLGLSSYRLSKELHVSAPRVNDLVRGKRSITADTAMRLSAYFGCSAQFCIAFFSDSSAG
jgi:addiction module HigA family antidote